MQGKVIDLEKLMRQNELVPAVGNMKVNARGDEIGKGGKILKKREEIVAEYYETNPKAKHHKIKKEPIAEPLVKEQTVKVEPKSKKTFIEDKNDSKGQS